MIYENAETAQDIARLLRSAIDPIVITAQRQSGKTTELLKFAEEKYPRSNYIIVCPTHIHQEHIIRKHWQIFNRIDQAHIVSARLMGEPLGGVDVAPPLMLDPHNIHLFRGQGKKIFCDEWNFIPEGAQQIIIDSGLLVAAVTS